MDSPLAAEAPLALAYGSKYGELMGQLFHLFDAPNRFGALGQQTTI